MSIHGLKNKISRWWIIYITGDFNWLKDPWTQNKNWVKNSQKLLNIYAKKTFCFFLRMYKMSQISKEAYKKCEIEVIDEERYFRRLIEEIWNWIRLPKLGTNVW